LTSHNSILYNYYNRTFIATNRFTERKKIMGQKPTIQELERILDQEEEIPIEILPNGEIRARGQTGVAELGGKKPLTMREDLGGEYGTRRQS
jgi:hypothetical protein